MFLHRHAPLYLYGGYSSRTHNLQKCSTMSTPLPSTSDDCLAAFMGTNDPISKCRLALESTKSPGRYEVIDLLGWGAFGGVVLVHDKTTGESHAIKVIGGIDSNKPYRQATKNEVSVGFAMKVIKHGFASPYVSGAYCLVMDKMESAEKWLIRVSAQDRDAKVLSMLHGVLLSMAKMHQLGVFHRDIKLQNMLVAEEDGVVKSHLADFGNACKNNGTGAVHPKGGGTLPTMAPEVILHPAAYSAACDMWSFAVAAAEALAGQCLFVATNRAGVLRCTVELLGLPESADELMSGATLKDKDKNDFERALTQPLDEHATPAQHGCLQDFLRGRGVSVLAVHFISCALQWDPAKRITVADALAHPLFKNQGLPSAVPHVNSETRTALHAALALPVAEAEEETGQLLPVLSQVQDLLLSSLAVDSDAQP